MMQEHGYQNKTYSIFTLNFGKYKSTIAHSKYFLLELEIQDGFSKFNVFCKRLESISKYSTSNFAFAFICTKEDPSTVKPIGFTP